MLKSHPTIAVIGAPEDLGQKHRGVDMGPSAIRIAGLLLRLRELGYQVVDAGDVTSSARHTVDPGDEKLRFVEEVIHDCEAIAMVVEKAVRAGHFPLVLGGDHSVAMGSTGGTARVDPRQGLLWIDAHADFNTPETTPSGNIHGMPVAHILGHGDERLVGIAGVTPKALEENTVLIGLRSVDRLEAETVRASRAKFYTMRDVDLRGVPNIMEEAIAVLTGNGVERVHLSFDADAVDPRHAPGTGTPVRGGFSYRESHLIMEILAEADIITSADFTEVNPVLDDRNMTAELVVELICSLAGKRVIAPGT
jgi:arginase